MSPDRSDKNVVARRCAGPRRGDDRKGAFPGWSLPRPRNQITVERDVQVPMSDGTILLADHYIPVAVRPRRPYLSAARTA